MNLLCYIFYALGIRACIGVITLTILTGNYMIRTQYQMQILHNQMQVEHEKIIRIAERILNEGATK